MSSTEDLVEDTTKASGSSAGKESKRVRAIPRLSGCGRVSCNLLCRANYNNQHVACAMQSACTGKCILSTCINYLHVSYYWACILLVVWRGRSGSLSAVSFQNLHVIVWQQLERTFASHFVMLNWWHMTHDNHSEVYNDRLLHELPNSIQ